MPSAHRTLAIVQARLGSQRLPGKVLTPLGHQPLLAWLLQSLRQCKMVEKTVVATSDEASDDPLYDWLNQQGVEVVRGSQHDVVDRFATVLEEYPCHAFVRVCADSPLLDHRLVDHAVALFHRHHPQLVSNVAVERTFPPGQSVEVVHSDYFLETVGDIPQGPHREHVITWFYDPDLGCRIHPFFNAPPQTEPGMAVDTPADLARLQQWVSRLSKPHWEYSLGGLLQLAPDTP